MLIRLMRFEDEAGFAEAQDAAGYDLGVGAREAAFVLARQCDPRAIFAGVAEQDVWAVAVE